MNETIESNNWNKGKIIKFSIPENHVQIDNFTFTSQLVSILGNMRL